MDSRERLVDELIHFGQRMRFEKSAASVEPLRAELRSFTNRIRNLPDTDEVVLRKVLIEEPPAAVAVEWHCLKLALKAKGLTCA